MFSPMKRKVSLYLFALAAAVGLSACADTEKKPVGPVSDTTVIPWNTPISGQGQGQMGMMPQNQYRR